MDSLTSSQGWTRHSDFGPLEASTPSRLPAASNGRRHSRYACFGDFCLDFSQRELSREGARIRLQGKVCDVLLVLLETPGAVVTREALRARLWPPDSGINYDANVNTTVNKLRHVLGDSSERHRFVETIPRKGYRFIAPLQYTDVAPLPARPPRWSSRVRAWAVDSAGESREDLKKSAMSSLWFKAGLVALLLSAAFLGAALMLYTRR
jgi:DNA-binding winged helix-turn-helix (wHTH) protein